MMLTLTGEWRMHAWEILWDVLSTQPNLRCQNSHVIPKLQTFSVIFVRAIITIFLRSNETHSKDCPDVHDTEHEHQDPQPSSCHVVGNVSTPLLQKTAILGSRHRQFSTSQLSKMLSVQRTYINSLRWSRIHYARISGPYNTPSASSLKPLDCMAKIILHELCGHGLKRSDEIRSPPPFCK